MRYAHGDSIGAQSRETLRAIALRSCSAFEARRLPALLPPSRSGCPARRPDPPICRSRRGAWLRVALYHRPSFDRAPVLPRQLGRTAGKGAASTGRRRPPARPRGVAGETADGPPSAPADLQVGRLDRPPDLASRADHRGFEGDRRRADKAEDIAP